MTKTKSDWVRQKLEENNYNRQIVKDLYEDFLIETGCNWTQESYNGKIRQIISDLKRNGDIEDYDLEENYIKSEASKQRVMDTNNLLRKSNRESYRLYNTLIESYNTMTAQLDKYSEKLNNIKIVEHKGGKEDLCAILSVSDWHCNEIINPDDSFGNSYNFEVLSKRAKKFIVESKKELKNNNIKEVYLIFLGDMFNSSRRLSEITHMANALTSACLLLTYVFEQIIVELSKDFNVHVSFVCGNESRIGDFMENSNLLSASNYDYLLFHNLRQLFRNKKVDFITPKNNVQHTITLKNGFTGLFTHGHTIKGDIKKAIPSLLQQYAYNGQKIHGVFLGHFHNCMVGDTYGVSSSLCGGNAYSNNDLHFLSRASQNLYICEKDCFRGIKIDLQNVDNYKGYNLVEELQLYNNNNPHSNNTVTIKNLV